MTRRIVLKTKDEKIFVRCCKSKTRPYWDIYVGRKRDGGNHAHFAIPIVDAGLPWKPVDRGFLKRVIRRQFDKTIALYENTNAKRTRRFRMLVDNNGEMVCCEEINIAQTETP